MVGRSRTAQVAALCGAQFVDVLGVTSAVTAIPAMLTGVSAPTQATPVVATVYALFFGELLVFGARLGDRYGHRRVLLTGIAAFAVVSVIGATAHDVVQLVVARGLQGAAAAVSVPPALRLLLDASPAGPQRRTALAAWSATGAAAGALGYLVGGGLTDLFSRRAVFWVNLPVGLVLLVAIWLLVPPSAAAADRTRLDLLGAVLLVTAVMAVILGASLSEDPRRRISGGLLVTGGLVLGGAVRCRAASSHCTPGAQVGVRLTQPAYRGRGVVREHRDHQLHRCPGHLVPPATAGGFRGRGWAGVVAVQPGRDRRRCSVQAAR